MLVHTVKHAENDSTHRVIDSAIQSPSEQVNKSVTMAVPGMRSGRAGSSANSGRR